MSRTGTDLLNRPSRRIEPEPSAPSGLDLESGLLVLLAVAAVAAFGLLIYSFVTMATALP
jgi:hypothetical protein